MVDDSSRQTSPRVTLLRTRRRFAPRLGALLFACLCSSCQTRSEDKPSPQASVPSSPPAVGQAVPPPVVKPFRVLARVKVSGFSKSGEDAKPVAGSPEQQQQVEERLQSPWFAGELRRCYSSQVPVDTTIFLNVDRQGKVTRAVLEGVPAAFGQCVAELFNGLTIPALGAPSAEHASDTLSIAGVIDVQTD